MALTEDRVLVSFEINLQTNTIQVLWSDRILRDGEVISVAPHRGAYGLENGELPDYIQEQVQVSLSAMASEALVSAVSANARLNQLLSDRDASIAQLNNVATEKDAALEQAVLQVQSLQQANAELTARVAELEAASAGA